MEVNLGLVGIAILLGWAITMRTDPTPNMPVRWMIVKAVVGEALRLAVLAVALHLLVGVIRP